MKQRIKIASTGTGSTDGLASQVLCKLNVAMFAGYYGYEYIDIPFDDSIIKGNNQHHYGDYSTALQNIFFSFPGYRKINPLGDVYENIKIIELSKIDPKPSSIDELRLAINFLITSESSNYELFILNGFHNLFHDKGFLYNRVSRGMNLVIDPLYSHSNLNLNDKLKICVHIRRGDITTHEVNFSRIIPMNYFNNVVDSVKKVLFNHGVEFFINLHIEGDSDGFAHQHTKFIDGNPIDSFFDIYSADLVISSKSSHSTVPSYLSGKLMIYPSDTWMTILPGWISADKDGFFDESKFITSLKNYLLMQ